MSDCHFVTFEKNMEVVYSYQNKVYYEIYDNALKYCIFQQFLLNGVMTQQSTGVLA